ncbi:MAG: acylneuraminate cytidylyltransferase family protein [Chitinophagia bacterium]|nr:acylneuraminate cytidylyltransferase family protein [Chitinophagia bacterium]
MNILVTICARGGSKGIPGKNTSILNGKHLISYSINVAFAFVGKHGGKVSLSTDSEEIKTIASSYGLNTEYKRPDQHATDAAGKIPAIRDLLIYEEQLENTRFDYVLDLDVTSPLRTMEDLENALTLIAQNPEALNIFSVSPPNRNPYFNMVEPTSDGFCKLVKDGFVIKSRQSAPIVYDMNASFYFYRRHFFDEGWEIALTPKSMFYVVPHMCFDLDHPSDFRIMELLMKENLLDFSI